MRLAEKVAVITGGAGDIGRAIALRFAQEGAAVVVNDLSLMAAESVTDKIQEAGGDALPLKADIANPQDAERLIQSAVTAFGKIDILIANAGIRQDAPLHALTAEQWNNVLLTNLSGSFHCIKAAQPHMVQHSYGKIVIMSSPIPAGLGSPGQANYSAANAGLRGLTTALATELGAYNITVNCIAPDFIKTQMTREAIRADGLYIDDYEKIAHAVIPLRRLGAPEDVANAALFLSSDESSYISGQTLEVKGGP